MDKCKALRQIELTSAYRNVRLANDISKQTKQTDAKTQTPVISLSEPGMKVQTYRNQLARRSKPNAPTILSPNPPDSTNVRVAPTELTVISKTLVVNPVVQVNIRT